ncbi:MAG: hypothetical protein Q8R00_01215 [Candidatus Nanoarchaeia archaeon]|nr:hypothetical protein [Candidatus Nanoarchaeia archaeon]
MKVENVNAVSTVVIAFVTVVGAMFGFYYGLKNEGLSLLSRMGFELIFVFALWQFIVWIKRGING